MISALVVTLAGAANGCSFTFVSAPKRDPRTRVVTCNDTYGWPVLDTMIAIVPLAGILYAASSSGAQIGANVAVDFGLMALFAASAVYGYSQVNACFEEYDLDRNTYQSPPDRSIRRRPIRPTPKPAPLSQPTPANASPDAGAPPDGGADRSGAPIR